MHTWKRSESLKVFNIREEAEPVGLSGAAGEMVGERGAGEGEPAFVKRERETAVLKEKSLMYWGWRD